MATKKDFKRDPATAFISSATEKTAKPPKKTTAKATATPRARAGKAPEGYKLNPEYIETKSRRVQALVQPSVYEAVKAKASSLGISTNEAINEAMRLYAEL